MATSMITMELLGRGTHADPRHGCNVLEFASVLVGEPWRTPPHSVHPALAAVAGTVNDLLADDRRRLLVPIAPWLLGTSSADPGVWPAVVNVCARAAAQVVGHDRAQLLADLHDTSSRLAEAGSPGCERRRRSWPSGWPRRWARYAIGSALRLIAGSGDQGDAAAALCQVLVDCINECRRLAGQEAVDPRLRLLDCPRRMAVQPRLMWAPGCEWMQLGYQPVFHDLPSSAYPAQAQAPDIESPAGRKLGQAGGQSERWTRRNRSARSATPRYSSRRD
jgi:hypothetical protein